MRHELRHPFPRVSESILSETLGKYGIAQLDSSRRGQTNANAYGRANSDRDPETSANFGG